MRIALTHNIRISADASETRYAPPETVDALVDSLGRLGHDVVRIETSGAVADTLRRLEGCRPDLVYNISEGWPGGPGQEFFPGLFDHLGLPYTGSDGLTLALALNKHLTKLVLRDHGVATPRWQFVRDVAELDLARVGLPAMVKPNDEATSRGITSESVVTTSAEAEKRVALVALEYPGGFLVEQYVEGRDVTVDFLEYVDNEYGGVLEPTEITVHRAPGDHRAHEVLDYGLKNGRFQAPTAAAAQVTFRTPPDLPADVIAAIRRIAARCVRAVGLRDIATVDFRVTPDGSPYVLEVNGLPRLDPGLRSHRTGEVDGVLPQDRVVAAVVASAARRHGLRI